MDVLMVYAGILAMLVGLVTIIKPIPSLWLKSRRMGGFILASGFTSALVGATLPYNVARPALRNTLIDKFMPIYDFSEFHSIRIQAPSDRVFRAIKQVTPLEIRFLILLNAIRSLSPTRLIGKGGAVPGATKPILVLATSSSFVLLAEETNRELVVGTIGKFWKLRDGTPPRIASPQDFLAFDHPDYAKATLNFYVLQEGEGSTRVSTETRVLSTDLGARRKFSVYWRVIYPGSALLRKMWLQAVKRRAETGL